MLYAPHFKLRAFDTLSEDATRTISPTSRSTSRATFGGHTLDHALHGLHMDPGELLAHAAHGGNHAEHAMHDVADHAAQAAHAAARRFALTRFDSQGFRTSVTWSASSTPLTLTPDPGASLRVDAELLL